MRLVHRSSLARGFTLIELLITLLIVSVGMLGLAKLQAAAVSESSVSRIRSLMTFQAESLSGMMQSNRGYWAATTSPAPSFTVVAGSGVVTDNAGTLDNSLLCNAAAAPCTNKPAAVAGYDAKVWANAFSQQFPAGRADVKCTLTANFPTTCDITLSWSERYVAINKTATDASSTAGASTMVLHVQP